MAKAAVSAAVAAATVQDVGEAGAYLTQAQGAGLVNAGLATVDMTNTNSDGAAFVTLTDAGKAALAGNPAPAASKPVITVRNDIAPPATRKRGRKGGSMYPIDTMEVGQSFHIAVTAENPDPANRIASSIANARLKYAVPVVDANGQPVMIQKTTHTYKKNPDGKGLAKDAEGHRIVESSETVTVQKTELGREWMVATVDASDPDGPGARVWRTK